VLAAGLAAVAAVGLVVTGGGAPAPQSEAFAVELATADGGTTTLAGFTGRPLVVNFFASWCPPCRAEMPAIEAVHQGFGDRVRVLGVNVDFDTSTWRSFVAESGVTYETVFEPTQDLLRALGGTGMPTTVLLSGDGEVVHVHTGILDEASLSRLIEDRLLGTGGSR
jgi:thiol-disulfide isomerase/thioredoxin